MCLHFRGCLLRTSQEADSYLSLEKCVHPFMVTWYWVHKPLSVTQTLESSVNPRALAPWDTQAHPRIQTKECHGLYPNLLVFSMKTNQGSISRCWAL